ncbi:hypothetical protein UB43_09535 [Pseudomonas sp. 21]|uniref:DUF1654 domain-containing protein n=1 Tax=unclassified Pseudomonas TaxID=196821 RepID=UPI0005EB1163|nr:MULTISPECIES: DUF1654 domain-containing protein [unclassified Pseudomonas]KJK02264.1 hypothetical protein UB43_09535 [Pseudomonas sp. 21]MBV7582968.1 DUF1654 domain-containing protein [Pseudomonas sp. PDM33]
MHAATYNQLSARVNALLADPTTLKNLGITLRREASDDSAAWSQLVTDLRQAPNLTLLPLQDGAIRLAWHSWLD